MFDTIIIGGGIAGFTAALFAARRGLSVLVIAKDIGGQANSTDLIENFPGIGQTSGFGLVATIRKQAEKFGINLVIAEATKIKKISGGFVVTAFGSQYKSQTLILCLGKTPKDMGVSGEEFYKGRGISYCVDCDGPLFKKKQVAVVGAGEYVLDSTLTLSKFCRNVFCLIPSEKLFGHPALIKAVQNRKNVSVMSYSQVLSIQGAEKVEGLEYLNLANEKQILKIDGIFVELGYSIKPELYQELLETDELGQIVTGSGQSTSVSGIFAAGDITDSPYKQAVISSGQAASAALSAFDYLMRQKGATGLSSDWTQIKILKK
ncbi:MAG: NAD(P)/FAD-dependent oxidoreductase [Acidobacteriaceae bacterium]